MPTTTLSTRTSILRLHDPFNEEESEYTDVKIEIERKKYDSGQDFFYVTYAYSYPPCNHEKRGNPFLSSSYKEHAEGDIVAANEMTERMMEYLLMDLDDMTEVCGRVSPLSYKISLMRALTHLWD